MSYHAQVRVVAQASFTEDGEGLIASTEAKRLSWLVYFVQGK